MHLIFKKFTENLTYFFVRQAVKVKIAISKIMQKFNEISIIEKISVLLKVI